MTTGHCSGRRGQWKHIQRRCWFGLWRREQDDWWLHSDQMGHWQSTAQDEVWPANSYPICCTICRLHTVWYPTTTDKRALILRVVQVYKAVKIEPYRMYRPFVRNDVLTSNITTDNDHCWWLENQQVPDAKINNIFTILIIQRPMSSSIFVPCWQFFILLQTEIDGSCQTKVSVPVNTELILLYLSDKSLDIISYLYIK